MKNFLRVTALAICAIFMVANVSAQDNYDATTMGEKVYLETASWGQNSPFNKQIFTEYGGSTNAKAGCVPTAYAIVMRYHGFPEEGTAKTLYNCQAPTYVEITDRVYDFSKMPLTYNSNWTQEQIDEVSKFFSHVLHACFPSSIGTGATTVNEGSDSKVLNDYFNYQLINASYQANFTMEQWIEKIKESIDNGCPIPYASDNSGTGDTRHMFVLDGYTANNYFHFNFGWNGSGNGWFKLDAITPSQGDNYSWIDGAEHYALFNLAPKTDKYTVTATANPATMGTVSINSGTAGTTASAEINENFTATLTAHPAQGYALANWTKNGVVVGTKNTLKVKVGASDNDYVANFDDEANVLVEKDCTFTIYDVEKSDVNGNYCSTWTTNDGIVLSCTKGSEAAYALSTSVNTLFAKGTVGNSETLVTDITYTLTAPTGYIIKAYSFNCKSANNRYTIDVNVGGNTTNVTYASATVISASDINAKSTSFVLSSTYNSGRPGLSIPDGITVTIQSEGGGSTPTPDPTPTTYTINATAGAGGSVTINGEAVSQKNVNENSTVTVVATPQTGYSFVNWTSGTSTIVSTNATYSFTATGNTSLLANFAQATYTVNVEATEGGSAYIGTKGTTRATAAYNGNVTITAEANNGYEFVKWTDGEGNLFSTNASVPVSVTTDARYIAVFEAEANEPVEVSGNLGFTFTRNGSDVDVTVSGAVGVTATIAAESPDATNTTTTTGIWNTGGAMANSTDVLCTSTNTSRATEGSPITYTLTVNGLRAKVTDVAFTHIAVNSGGNLQPSDGTIRHCNFKLEANGNDVGTLSDQNIWIPSGSTDKTIEFNDLSVAADGTLTIKLTLYKGTSNDGCYYGLKKITLTAEEPETDPLAGKYFRLKTTVNSAAKYMNVGTLSDNSHGNVNMVDLNESSDDQIFLFEKSGDGYKLKANSGNYIKCAEWNVNANTTDADEASVLLFEESGDGYLINWYNTFKGAIKYFNVQTAKGGDKALHPYCDGAKNSAFTWVLEEVIPSNEKTLNVTFNNATYTKTDGTELTSGWGYQVVTQTTPAVTIKVAETINNFGYTTGVISGVKIPYLYKNTNFILSISEQYKITGYKITVRGQDNSYSGDFTCSVDGNETSKATLSGTTTQTLSATDLNTNTINIGVGGTSGNGIFITALEITYIENEFTPLPFKAEIENWRNDNPNTHLGTITIGGTAMKLTPEHLNASELTMPVVEGTTLAFTRKYRGFEFNGFYIGATSLGTNPTLTADNVDAINETTPLVAKFTATDDVTLFYDDDEFSYRIPAIVKTVKDDKHKLIAISDYRHSFDDIGRDNHKTGTTQVDLVIRTSEDNGATWTAKKTIAEGSQHFGYGDAAAVANGQDVLVMAVAGNVFYAYANSENPQQAYRIYSNDNGETWEKEDISSNMESLFPDYHGLFFGSGKLAVDPDFNGSGNARVYGAILMKDSQGERNYVLYSDNWGKTWNILGNAVAARQNEPKVEILPNGQILLSARRGSGRTFNVFTYTDKANNAGTWSTATNGCDNGGNSTNGEIICLDAKKPNGKPTKILLQSQPYGSDRRNVSIWYKEISANETYAASSIASDWTMGKQVSTQLSAYSAMCLQENGEIALFFEEAPCYADDYTKGYSMVYVPLTIEEITGENFLNPNAVVETVTVDVTLTDNEGNTYTHQFDYLPGDATEIDAALKEAYPFITELGEGNLQGSDNYYTYTNTVTLPFKVSNANTTVWHNIYWPANDTSPGKYYPIYLLSTAEGDTYVAKKTETKHYGESSYNTLNWADELSWAVYSVDGTLNFKFKNKLTGKFMAVNGVVSTGSTNNVIYTDEANATTFTLEKYTGTNTYYGNYAIKSVYNGTTGYVCNTSVGHANATNYTGTNHAGAWAKFVEAPDYKAIVDALTENVAKFGAGNGNYTDNNDINAIKAIIENIGTTPLNTLNTHTETVQNVKDSYTEITLTVPAVNDVVPGSVSIAGEPVNNKFVPGNTEIELLATANAGYVFKNWTRTSPQATAAARTGVAREAEVVSADNPYRVTVSDALSLTANFEQIVVNATLTDAQSNTYNVQLSGFTAEITKEAVADKLREAYPYITLGTTDQEGNVIDFGVLNIDGTAYTYTNRIELPFKVSNTTYLWHNIYYPSNNTVGSKPGCPNYIAALNEDEVVDMAASGGYYYGDNPTYNTKDGGNSICWAIYNVNNSFEFIFKSRVTGKYIKVESVVNATGNTQNVKFVENAEYATAFTLLKDADSYNGDYALVAKVGNATGYLCATSSDMNYVTHFDRNNHQGAWVKFVEAPDYFSMIQDLGIMLGLKFGAGDGKYINTDAISEIDNDIANNSENITLNTIKQDSTVLNDAINNWPAVRLTINPVEGGTTNINGEENVVHKYVPNEYKLPLAAVPAEGYHFVSWTDGASEIETTEYTKTINGGKGDVIELTANFAKNSYTVSVSTNGTGGSAMIGTETSTTVEHGSEVTLTAVENDGYEFVNWTKGTDVVSTNATYTFPVTADGEYVANFELSNTPVNYYTVRIETEGLSNDKFAAYINTGTTQNETAKDYEPGSTVRLIAIQDNSNVGSYGYAFVGWYLNGTLVDIDEEIEFNITSNVTYTAKFVEGIRISTRAERGWPHIYLFENDKEVGGTSMSTILVPGRRLKLSVTPEYGCSFTHWTVGDEVVSTDNPFITEPLNEAVTFKAICEPAYYNLTVRSNPATAGKVTVNSNESSSEMTVKVGHNTDATITATPNDGFKFVNWTKGTDVVSTNVTYTIAAIDAIEDLKDVEYIANFIEIEEPEAGVYYRIGFDGFNTAAAAGAARAGATRAVGDEVTYSITPANGTPKPEYEAISQWTFTKDGYPAGLTLKATSGSTLVKSIWIEGDYLDLATGGYPQTGGNSINNVTYTLSVQNSNYRIIGYEIECKTNSTVTFTPNSEKLTNSYKAYGEKFEPVTEKTFSFESDKVAKLTVKSFTVTIQEVGGESEGGGETPEPDTEIVRYYILSKPVSETNNAMVMEMETEENYASSIFYHAGNKLLSYDKGTYIKEDGGTRGLQEVGTSGNVTITTADGISKIAAPSYLHAVINQSGTSYVDHCGSDNGDPEHNFVLEEVTKLPVTISSAEHATFYAPVAVKIPNDVKAYVLNEKSINAGSWVTMTLLKYGIIPAKTGVILKAAQGTYDFNIVGNDVDHYYDAIDEAEDNVLTGTVAKTKITHDAYILANRNSMIGLYPVAKNSYLNGSDDGVRFTNNSHKAYLPVEGNFAALLQQGVGFRFIFDDDATTEIEDVETENVDTIYDLQGRKLSEITEPGIYIVNGKKIFVK